MKAYYPKILKDTVLTIDSLIFGSSITASLLSRKYDSSLTCVEEFWKVFTIVTLLI
jgi:hypothetical protein